MESMKNMTSFKVFKNLLKILASPKSFSTHVCKKDSKGYCQSLNLDKAAMEIIARIKTAGGEPDISKLKPGELICRVCGHRGMLYHSIGG
ncbi:hypothetical protein KJ969_03110 [Patescibacteria group bacterium]|nr:hypothetical protein [Patescibacteria group bacterium]MBU1922146.1 hypothetical protein [Patescibacteria group bacterium]